MMKYSIWCAAWSLCLLGHGCGGGNTPADSSPRATAPAPAPAPATPAPKPADPADPAGPAERVAGDGYAVCLPDGFRELTGDELREVGATGRWFTRPVRVGGFPANIGIVEGVPPRAYELLTELQTAIPERAATLCDTVLSGMSLGSRKSDVIRGGVVSVSWGRTCQAEVVVVKAEKRRGRVTIMRANNSYRLVIAQFSEADTVAIAGYDQLIGCWKEE